MENILLDFYVNFIYGKIFEYKNRYFFVYLCKFNEPRFVREPQL